MMMMIQMMPPAPLLPVPSSCLLLSLSEADALLQNDARSFCLLCNKQPGSDGGCRAPSKKGSSLQLRRSVFFSNQSSEASKHGDSGRFVDACDARK
jgi:hypothetical protein